MSKYGETIEAAVTGSALPRLHTQPPALGGWLPSGDPLDAGTMHHLANNTAHLARESVRHLVADVGPGALTYSGDGWDGGYTDTPDTAATQTDAAHTAIAWDRKTARSYHLPNLIADRPLPGGGYGVRVICVEIDCYVDSADSLRLFAALTSSYSTPDRGTIAIATWSSWTDDGEYFEGNLDTPNALPIGRQIARLWLIAKSPASSPWAQWRCRSSGPSAALQTLLFEGHLWVGWKNGDANNAIISISAWEQPEPYAPLVDIPSSSFTRGGTRMDLNGGGSGYVSSIRSHVGYNNAQTCNNTTLNRSGHNARFCGEFRKASSSYSQGSTNTSAWSEATFFAVLTPRNAPSGGYVPVWEIAQNVGSTIYPAGGGAGIRSQGTQYGVWAEDPSLGFVGSTLAVDRTYIVCGVVTTTTIYWYVNGVLTGSIARPAAGFAATTGMHIGFLPAAVADAPSSVGDFDLYEALCYHSALSESGRIYTLEYLNRHHEAF